MSLAVISRTRRIRTRVLVAAHGADWEAAATDTRALAAQGIQLFKRDPGI
ncbi:MAG: hypothetical protein WB611_00770 [Stellaceae bacterium]